MQVLQGCVTHKKRIANICRRKKENIKRVPLEMQKEDYKILKAAADARGEKVNEFVKKAIRQRLEQEGLARVDKTAGAAQNV